MPNPCTLNFFTLIQKTIFLNQFEFIFYIILLKITFVKLKKKSSSDMLVFVTILSVIKKSVESQLTQS